MGRRPAEGKAWAGGQGAEECWPHAFRLARLASHSAGLGPENSHKHVRGNSTSPHSLFEGTLNSHPHMENLRAENGTYVLVSRC